ncbi:MAG: helix-turn-helix transcriptional regulator [Gemmatimonadaceae bacterium]
MAHRLPNYLRAYRVRAGLSQEEMAYLLGLSGGPKISKYEMGRRMPDIRTLIAYERVLGVPVSELYAGLHNQVDRETRRRARTLAERVAKTAQQSGRAYKLAGLAAIARPVAGESDLPQWDAA